MIPLFFISCKSKVPVFEIYQEANFTIPSGLDPISTHHTLIKNIPSFLNQNLEEKQVSLNNISQLYAGKGKIISVFTNANFGIVRRISVWIYNTGEYENRIEIYYRDEVPLSLNGELKLLSTGEDVREIINKDTYNIDVEVQFKDFVSSAIDCRISYSFAAYSE
jgi:hypothetical protein